MCGCAAHLCALCDCVLVRHAACGCERSAECRSWIALCVCRVSCGEVVRVVSSLVCTAHSRRTMIVCVRDVCVCVRISALSVWKWSVESRASDRVASDLDGMVGSRFSHRISEVSRRSRASGRVSCVVESALVGWSSFSLPGEM